MEYALEKCKVHPHMDKSKLYGYTRDAKNLLYNMKRNTNDPNAFGGTEYQRHRTVMEPKIDKCIVTLDVYNQYCSEIETATANKFHCYFSLYLTTQGFEEEKAMKICGNLGIVLKEHLVYVSIPNDIWNNKILDNNERIKLQQITQQYMSDMDKKARDQATKMAQTVTLKSLFETCTDNIQNRNDTNDFWNVHRIMKTLKAQGLQTIESCQNLDTLLEQLESIITTAYSNIQQLINRGVTEKNDEQVVSARAHITDISKEIDNIRQRYIKTEPVQVSPPLESNTT
jgi:hypothetical protein